LEILELRLQVSSCPEVRAPNIPNRMSILKCSRGL